MANLLIFFIPLLLISCSPDLETPDLSDVAVEADVYAAEIEEFENLDIILPLSLCKPVPIDWYYVRAKSIGIIGVNNFETYTLIPYSIDSVISQDMVIMYSGPYNDCENFCENYLYRLEELLTRDVRYASKYNTKSPKYKEVVKYIKMIINDHKKLCLNQ